MKRALFSILIGACLGLSACQKVDKPTMKAIAGLRADMTDEQLLRVMKRDPQKMTAEETLGPDGFSKTYSDTEEEITITRSVVSGIAILRYIKKTDVWQTWDLGKPTK